MIRRRGGIGIALENNCAIEFVDGRFYRVIRSNDYAQGYSLLHHDGKVVAKRIRQEKRLSPMEELAGWSRGIRR